MDAKERTSGNSDSSQQQCIVHYTSPVRDQATFKWSGRPTKNFTSLNTLYEQIWCEFLHTHDIPFPSSPISDIIRPEPNMW